MNKKKKTFREMNRKETKIFVDGIIRNSMLAILFVVAFFFL